MRLSRRMVWLACLGLLLVAAVVVLTMPLTTRQGVNYKVSARRIPAYVKGIDFIHRHYQYGALASTICSGIASARDCVLAIFRWTGSNIRPTPDGWPVIDDHVWHIIVRGHGKSDQIADVFTTLSTYAGIPAFWHELKAAGTPASLVLSFVRLEDGWVPIDVEGQVLFEDNDGGLATVEELLREPGLLDDAAASHPAYRAFISRRFLDPFVVPEPLRAELHQPWARLKYETLRAVGLTRTLPSAPTSTRRR